MDKVQTAGVLVGVALAPCQALQGDLNCTSVFFVDGLEPRC